MWLVIQNAEDPSVNQISLPLPEGDFTVGRSAECSAAIGDKSLSRCHIIITKRGSEVIFRDGGGSGEIELNGHEALVGSFKIGDSITIGDTLLSLHESPPKPQKKSNAKPPAPKMKKPLLVRASQLLPLLSTQQERGGVEGLLHGLLQYLVELLSAEQGFVLLRKGGGHLYPVATYAVEDAKQLLAVSRTVYTRALESGEMVIVSDTNQDPQLKSSLTFALGGESRTVICAPLLHEGLRLGVVYVDLKSTEDELSKDRLELVDTVSALAAERLSSLDIRDKLLRTKGALIAAQEGERAQEELVHGNGEAAKELLQKLQAAAKSDTSVLITGETGTGKEMVARSLHRLSSRRDKPFIALNCAALPLDLIEAELFGVEKGAFSGAEQQRAGHFESAHGGTIFLDEIGELPLEMQVKLLRILQERKVTRLGGTKAIELDFRLLCATNRCLEEAVKEGSFRSDLYFRIKVYPIALVPLRERKEDILPLATYFQGYFQKRYNKELKELSPEAEKLLLAFPWPGNVRQLRNVLERAVVFENSSQLTAQSFSFLQEEEVRSAAGGFDLSTLPRDYTGARELFERAYLERGLQLNGGNVSALIRESGVGRPTIYRWLKKYGIDPKKL